MFSDNSFPLCKPLRTTSLTFQQTLANLLQWTLATVKDIFLIFIFGLRLFTQILWLSDKYSIHRQALHGPVWDTSDMNLARCNKEHCFTGGFGFATCSHSCFCNYFSATSCPHSPAKEACTPPCCRFTCFRFVQFFDSTLDAFFCQHCTAVMGEQALGHWGIQALLM